MYISTNVAGILIVIILHLYINLGRIYIFTVWSLPIHEFDMLIYLFRPSMFSFISIVLFSIYEFHTCFVGFIMTYFIFWTIINGIEFLLFGFHVFVVCMCLCAYAYTQTHTQVWCVYLVSWKTHGDDMYKWRRSKLCDLTQSFAFSPFYGLIGWLHDSFIIWFSKHSLWNHHVHSSLLGMSGPLKVNRLDLWSYTVGGKSTMQRTTRNTNHDKISIILEIKPMCGGNAKKRSYDYVYWEHLHEVKKVEYVLE